MRRDLIKILTILVLLTGLPSVALAHGGQYRGPGGNSVGTPSRSGTPRSGGVTIPRTPTWRNWWKRNREDFFDVRERRTRGTPDSEGGQYDQDHEPATQDDVLKVILPVLLKSLKDKNPNVRDAAAIAVGRAGQIPVLEHLEPLLDDNVLAVKQAAIMGIGLIRHPIAERKLIAVLRNPRTRYKNRGMAALALGLSGGDDARAALTDRLGTASPIKDVAWSKLKQVEGCRAMGLGLIEDPALAASLVTALRSTRTRDETFHPMTLNALAHLEDPSSADLVLRSLGNRDNDIMRSAAILAGRVIRADQTDEVRRLIKQCKAERDKHAQFFMTISLGRIGSDDAVKYLRKVYQKGRNREHRGFAALALGIAKDTESAAIMMKALKSERDESLRSASAIGLGILEEDAAAKTILTILEKTKNPELRADLVTALAMLNHREALPEIRKITGEARNERLVQACGFALASMRDTASIPTMIRILSNSGSLQVKGGMATALGRTGDRRAIEDLVKLVENPRQTSLTQAFAVVALGLIGDKSPRSEFSRVAIDSNYALVGAEALLEVIDIF